MRKRLFYDIETSVCEGVFFRPGYNQTINPQQVLKHAKIICISYKWEGEEEVHNLDWGKKQCDKQLLKKFIKLLDRSDEIVAHNGDRFDIKWIRARALFHGLTMKPKYNSLDTYKLCKKYLALPSYKLAEVAKYYGLTPKIDAGGLQTWIDVVVNKSPKALDHMKYYCDGDIITLEEVFNKIRPYVAPSLNYSVLHGGEKFFCPECSSIGKWNKTYTTAAGTIQHYMKCRDKQCGTYYKVNNKTYIDYLKYTTLNNI